MNLPLDETTKTINYRTIPKGDQTIIHFEGSPSVIVLVNPDDGRKPYFYYSDKGFEDQIEMGVYDDYN